jgi:hypothetical protein
VGIAAVAQETDTTPPPPEGRQAKPVAMRLILSDELRLSRWAAAMERAIVRQHPRATAAALTRLRYLTEEGFPEVYLLLRQHLGADGTVWVRIRIPGPRNGRTGWVPRPALGPFRITRTFLLINRQTLRLTLYRSGRRIFRAPIGVGKPSTPTPAGRFWIREKFEVARAPFFGPRAIGTSAYSRRLTDWPQGRVIGLHGTSRPELVPGRPSHGCIRLRNRDIMRLYELLPLGTPVRIV